MIHYARRLSLSHQTHLYEQVIMQHSNSVYSTSSNDRARTREQQEPLVPTCQDHVRHSIQLPHPSVSGSPITISILLQSGYSSIAHALKEFESQPHQIATECILITDLLSKIFAFCSSSVIIQSVHNEAVRPELSSSIASLSLCHFWRLMLQMMLMMRRFSLCKKN